MQPIHSFDVQDSTRIKGIAIILMLAHHLFAFPSWWNDGITAQALFSLFDMDAGLYLGKFGKICVSLFLFLSGFGLYRIFERKGTTDIWRSVKKLYISYWKIFAIFVPLGYFVFAKLGYATKFSVVFDSFSMKTLVKDLTGWTYKYNHDWWFIKTYVVCLISFPLWAGFVRRNSVAKNVAAVIGLAIGFDVLFPKLAEVTGLALNDNVLFEMFFCQYTPCAAAFYMGAVMAKENLLEKADQKLTDLGLNHLWVDVLGIVAVSVCRNVVIGADIDAFYCVPFVLFATHIMRRFSWVGRIFDILGKNSTNMWLTHSFFIYYFAVFQPILYYTGRVEIIWPTLVAFTLAISVLIDLFYQGLGKIGGLVVGRWKGQ